MKTPFQAWPALLLFLALLVVLLAPFLLQPRATDRCAATRILVILSPHNEAVRREFETAFQLWHSKRYGESVAFDWRNIGGTSEIVRYLESEFAAARRANRTGIGIDLFFGGGSYEHIRQARLGNTAPCGVRERHPEWLKHDIIPERFSGEIFYDSEDRWYGCCLSSFGICYNTDLLAIRGIPIQPTQWEDLADFRLFRQIALADPTKSGSINKAFEMLIQEQMSKNLQTNGCPPANAPPEQLANGWQQALLLIRKIGANARYFTDSAGKVPLDVAQGNAAAGMCIDFYGRFQSELTMRNENSDRLRYLTPAGGSSVSVDPISILHGAANLETAQRFVDFCLSREGQQLWNTRVGAPGGPAHYALRRLPIRKDMYTEEYLRDMSDPDALPYEKNADFTYQAQWTGPLFATIRILIRAMCIDTHTELANAWSAINQAGGLEQQAHSAQAFSALPPEAEYHTALQKTTKLIGNKLEEARLVREWTLFFRHKYREAERLIKRQP